MRIVILTLLLTGCVSSGVVPMDKGTYMIRKTSAGCGFGSMDNVKPDLYTEANEFCGKSESSVETIALTGRNGVPFARCAHAELQFRCVKK